MHGKMRNAFRQAGTLKEDSFLRCLQIQSKTRLYQQERCRGRPCLRRARNRIQCRPFARPFALQPAKQLREPVQLHGATYVKQGEQDLSGEVLETVSRQATCDQSIVVRPNRSVVIRKRVVTRLAGSQRSNSPTAKEVGFKQSGRRFACVFCAGNTGKQCVSSIGGTHLAWTLVSIKGERVSSKVFAPKGSLKFLASFGSLRFEPGAGCLVSKRAAQSGRGYFGGIYIALHLTQGYRRLSDSAIGMKYRVV